MDPLSLSWFGLIAAACGFEEVYDDTAAGALSGFSEQGKAEGSLSFDRYMIYCSVRVQGECEGGQDTVCTLVNVTNW